MGENLVYWVWLSQCFSYGNGRLGKLLETLDDAKAFFQGGPELWRKSGLFSAQDLRRMEKTSLDRAAVILEECQKQDIRVISWLDEEYPRLLREIYAPPAVLYVKGSLAGLDQALTITAVGTREAIGYTRGVTGNLCYQLAQTGVVIISGCAQGIDEYAHRGTLKAGGRTIAVLGCGVDVNYPSANRELKEKILLSGGALISELPPGTNPDGRYFPTRNRLLAGLGMGVLVTHAPVRSGSLITADLALEQGKEIFCLPPYNIYDASCTGVVPLLKEGAKPVYSVYSILEEYYPLYADRINLELLPPETVLRQQADSRQRQKVADPHTYRRGRESAGQEQPPAAVVEPPARLSAYQRQIYDVLTEEPQPVDEIIGNAGMRADQALAALSELELMDMRQPIPDGGTAGCHDGNLRALPLK